MITPMRLRFRSAGIVFGALFIIGMSLSLPVCAEEAAGMISSPPLPAENISQDKMPQASVREQLSDLRNERVEKMPYLNRGYIYSAIREDIVRETLAFIAGGKKDLKEIISRAKEVHTPALAAKERISLARRRILVALRELFPEMNLKYQDREGSLGGSGPFVSKDWRWTFRQPVFRGGILWNTVLQEKAEMEAVEKEYEKTISDLIKDVSEAYFEFNRSLEVVSDQRNAIDKVQRFVQISGQKWDEELISEIEHLNVQSLYSQMQYDYESSRQELEISRLELQKFLNVPVNEDMLIQELYSVEELIKEGAAPSEQPGLIEVSAPESTGMNANQGGDIPNLEVLVDLAYQHRSELQVESHRLQAARLEERIKWGELLPRVDVVMEFGKLGESLSDDDPNPKLRKEFRLLLEARWNAAGNTIGYEFENDERAPTVTQFRGGGEGTQTTRNTFTIGVLDGLEAFADIKEAEVEKLDQIVELENAEKEVIRDVKQAYYDYQRALIQVKATLKRVDYRERLVQLARHRLDTNEIQISEYLQAEIDLLRERTELHQALADYFTAKAALNRAIGLREFFPIEEAYGK